MGHGDNRTGKAVEIILQNRKRRDIQIIRRFVQKQYVRCRHQHTQQIQTAFFAAAELGHRHPLQLRREEEAFQHLRRADALTVGRFNVIIRFLDIFQHTHIAVGKLAVLCKIANLNSLANAHFAARRLQLAGDDIHQR